MVEFVESLDPNLIYLFLIGALWMGVTAVYIPGTGIAELGAVILLGMSIVMMVNLPVSWVAVICLVVGISAFKIVPFISRKYAPVAYGGTILQAIGGLALFTDDRQVSLFVIGLTVALPIFYYQFILLPFMDKMKDLPTSHRDDFLVGSIGRVMKPLDPLGTVNVNSELWTAYSEEHVETGRDVMVVAKDGLRLEVEPLKEKRVSSNGYHEEVFEN